MRAAPPVTVILERPRAAVLALAVLAVAAIAVSAAWALQRADAWGALIVLLVCLHAGWLAWSVGRRPPLRLRWDGERWWLGARGHDDDRPGAIAVALDLGHWMLLRFRADDAAGLRRVRWLPTARAALGADWHALRCAVHSPRPAAAPDAVPSA